MLLSPFKVPPRYEFALAIVVVLAINVATGLITRHHAEPDGWLLLTPWILTVAGMVWCFALIGQFPPDRGLARPDHRPAQQDQPVPGPACQA